MSVVPNKPVQTDPYKTLGLSHDATPSQIKVTYRKLALQYHPDRQSPSTIDRDETSNTNEQTDKFVEIAAAYALLSDPARKKEYDHLYKFGAFDSPNNETDTSNANTASMNYRYTENYSGGYYTKPQSNAGAASTQHQHAAPFYRSMSSASNDSFFDDLLYSPETKKKVIGNTTADASSNNRGKQKPGIGFSFAPLGKHLSIHVPSRNEIVMGMARGEFLKCAIVILSCDA